MGRTRWRLWRCVLFVLVLVSVRVCVYVRVGMPACACVYVCAILRFCAWFVEVLRRRARVLVGLVEDSQFLCFFNPRTQGPGARKRKASRRGGGAVTAAGERRKAAAGERSAGGGDSSRPKLSRR